MSDSSPSAGEPAQPPKPSPEASPQPADPLSELFTGLFEKPWKEAEEIMKRNIPLILASEFAKAALPEFNVLLFLDQSNTIGEDHADRIYSAVCGFEEKKDILLIVGSRGGSIEPAYLISKNCKAVAKKRFVVAVPRRAKSAATLLSLGADEIHMGAMSELGPIDPQLGGVPALALTNALQTLARLVSENPKSADMFAKYLESKLDLGILGYFERINDSATQYASRLLEGKALGENRTASSLADHLVNHYKDHSFVIDKDEAISLFGTNIVKVQTKEYSFANSIDQQLRWYSRIAKYIHKKEVTFIGSFGDCLKVRDRKSKDEKN